MARDYPYPESEGIRSIGLGIILTLLTCGFYGLYWQFKQLEALNAWLGREEFSFLVWLLLSIVTCGIFAIYYEYKKAKGINEIQEQQDEMVNSDLPVICVLLTLFGLQIVSIAIQQNEIHKFYRANVDF